jgi:hypothetical protein
MRVFERRSAQALAVLSQQENFWRQPADSELPDLLRYSLFLGFFPFAGYLCLYTIRGTIWNYWPFVQTTLDVGSGLVFAALQWILFAIFPVLCAQLLEIGTSRSTVRLDINTSTRLIAYSLTPVCLATLFIGVPYFDRIVVTIGLITFLYLQYYAFRISLGFTILRSAILTLCVLVLFTFIRELFVFAIGF